MSDIFREVDEDIRREQLKRLWDRFAPYILAAAVLIVVATAGYRGWVYWQETRAQSSGDRFMAAMRLSASGDSAGALAALEELSRDGSGGYPILSQFAIATQKAEAGDAAGSVAAFDAIAAGNAPEELRTLARLRAAMLLADTATLPDMRDRVGDLAAVGNVWRQTARELLGLVAWRTGDYVAAQTYFEDITSDQEAPQDLRQRAAVMLRLIDGKLAPAPSAAPAPAVAPAPPPVDAPAATDTTPAPAP